MNINNSLHTAGYVILPKKLTVPKQIIHECRTLFVRKKVKYIFNGTSTNGNDKKRYISSIDESSHIEKWLQKTHEQLVRTNLVTGCLFRNSSTVFASAAGCESQPAHCDYLKTHEFLSLLDKPPTFQPTDIKKGDSVLYTKDSNQYTVTVNQIHLDDYPNYYYTIQLPDGTEKQTIFQHLSTIPETENEKNIRRAKIPLIVLISIMDNTVIDVWENSINWMKMADNDIFNPPIQKKTITLQSGQICVLRGDLIHAGSAYADENFRIYSFYNNYNILPDENKVHLFGNQTEWEKEIRLA